MNKFVFILFFIGCGSSNYDQPITSISSRYPRLAPTKSNGILMSWFTQSDSTNWSLNWSEFSKGKWSKNKIITSGENYFVNWADFPSIFHFGGDTIAAHWLEKRKGIQPHNFMIVSTWFHHHSENRIGTYEEIFITKFRMILGLEQDSTSTNNSQPTISTIQNEQCYPRVEQGSQTTTFRAPRGGSRGALSVRVSAVSECGPLTGGKLFPTA